MFNTRHHFNAKKLACLMLATTLLTGISTLPVSAAVIPYDQVVNDLNPIAYWRHQGDALDETSNNHDGTINGTPTFVAGPVLPGITGNLAGDYGGGVITDIDVPDSNDFSFGDGSSDDPFSLSVWINPDTPSGAFNGIIGKDDSVGREWSLLLNSDGTLRTFLKHNGGGNQHSVDTDAAIPTGSWTHVAVTYDGSSTAAGLQFWVNGSMAAQTITFDYGSYVAMANTTAEVTVGSYFNHANLFEGLLDEVAVFDGVLTGSQILALSGEPQEAPVPEPSSILLLGLGALGLLRSRRQRKTGSRRHEA